MRRVLLTTLVLATAVASDASAQTMQRLARPYRGLFGGGPATDPNRTRTELNFTGSFLAGYDTWVSPGAGGGIDPAQERQSGRTFAGEAALAYFYGRTQRSLSIDGRVVSLGYSGIGVDPTIGGDVAIVGNTNLGRTSQLRATQNITYDPTLVLSSLIPTVGDPVSTAPGTDVTSGYLEQRSWSSNTSATLDRRWSARHTTQVGAEYMRSTFLDDFGYDTRSTGVTASHGWQFSRTSSIRGLYRLSDMSSSATDGLVTPMTNQQIEASFGYARRLSPTRQMSFGINGGATRVDTLDTVDRSALVYWTPSGGGNFSLDVGRSWSVAANYDRAVQVLQGVSLTSFSTDSAHVSVNGLIGSRIETLMSAMFSNGRAGGSNSLGTYENYAGSVQFRYALSRVCATSVYYDYYIYDFQNVPDLPTNFLASFDRHAIRVGITLWLPLRGSYADGRSRGAARGN